MLDFFFHPVGDVCHRGQTGNALRKYPTHSNPQDCRHQVSQLSKANTFFPFPPAPPYSIGLTSANTSTYSFWTELLLGCDPGQTDPQWQISCCFPSTSSQTGSEVFCVGYRPRIYPSQTARCRSVGNSAKVLLRRVYSYRIPSKHFSKYAEKIEKSLYKTD